MGASATVTILCGSAPTETFTSRNGGYYLGGQLIEFGADGLISECLGPWRRESAAGSGFWQHESGEGLEATEAYLAWIESFLIIDSVNRTVLWDLACLDIESPRAVNRMIETASPGWRAVWCSSGPESVWRHLHADSAANLYERRDRELWPGWRFVEVGDCWEVQMGHARGRAIRQPLREVLLESLGFRPDGSPIPGFSGHVQGPRTRRDTLAIELIESRVRLSPAAFLRPSGEICWDPRSLPTP